MFAFMRKHASGEYIFAAALLICFSSSQEKPGGCFYQKAARKRPFPSNNETECSL
jgi:hypothetical protein